MSFEIISDYSKGNLKEIPEKILEMTNLKMLFLERNLLTELPENFFHRLPNLMWLDLRNNYLRTLPKSIAYHEHLEHLLVTNNNIQRLPNEIGLLPNLKALQAADNPLVYPSRKIIQEGTKTVKKYLKEQYEMERAQSAERKNRKEKEIVEKELLEKNKIADLEEEMLLKVYNETSNLSFDKNSNRSKLSSRESRNNEAKSKNSTASNKSKSLEGIQKKLSDPQGLSPTLRVKKLDNPNKKQGEAIKIIHNINKSESKIRLKSYFNRSEIRGNLDRIPENSLKEGWLNKLRILLNDQERILQQERNLKSLTSWRQKKPSTTRSLSNNNSITRPDVPYATYPEYSKIPNREELTSQLNAFLQESKFIVTRPAQTSKLNLDKLLNDLVEQLKEMETTYSDIKSPRNEIEQAGKQIQTIMNIHKKLLKLKSSNDYM